MNGKQFAVSTLLAFVLLSLVFIPSSSQQRGDTYDPWVDTNDDGIIDLYDLRALSNLYGTSGEPINKTRLLLELQSSVISLTERVSALETNYSVTNIKLAPNAIPLASTYSTVHIVTTQTANWVDMDYTSVSLVLNRTSHLVIMFSCEAVNPEQWTSGGVYIRIRALVNSVVAFPPDITLTPIVYDKVSEYDNMDVMAFTYNFYSPSVSAGTYTIKIQWRVNGGIGNAYDRALIVVALPA